MSHNQLLAGDTFFLDTFALRQWDDPSYNGTRITHDKAEFLDRVHAAHRSGSPLVDGYAPFCKHIFVPNFVGAKVGALEITEQTKHLLRSGYSRRRPSELAVLTRWFPASAVDIPEAQHLDVILYSREQLLKEYDDMPNKNATSAAAAPSSSSPADGAPSLPDAPWGIISIKAQTEDYETPMQPITMLRNALGRSEGGSGVPLDRAAYDKSVAYWDRHATIAEGENPNGE